MRDHLVEMHAKYGLHICGEGGEYETFVLDCPLFKHRRIQIGAEPEVENIRDKIPWEQPEIAKFLKNKNVK